MGKRNMVQWVYIHKLMERIQALCKSANWLKSYTMELKRRGLILRPHWESKCNCNILSEWEGKVELSLGSLLASLSHIGRWTCLTPEFGWAAVHAADGTLSSECCRNRPEYVKAWAVWILLLSTDTKQLLATFVMGRS